MHGKNMNRRNFLKTGIAGTAGIGMLRGYSKDVKGDASTSAVESRGDMFELRYRQIHLDFHTSEEIRGIGEKFDSDEFADTLAKAYVDSVTCFGRCHHGWIYHETKKFPERKHPHLTRNLLKEQIEACHKRNIRVPVYVTVQWDYYTAMEHPEWLQISEGGSWVGKSPYVDGFYGRMCMNSPYIDFLKVYLNELLESLPLDGLFLDIVHAQDCSCKYCFSGMESEGIDPSDRSARLQYGFRVWEDFIHDMSDFIRRIKKDCSIFYNSGHVGPHHRKVADGYTHLELESLPSGGWGYLHFPLTSRYARNLGVDYMGMTGKFHTTWGDFHSFKNKAALQFECFNMLALNGKCSVGDQLHPNGKIDPVTYELIGSVYSEVEKKEPWCKGAKPVVEIGVLTPEEFSTDTSRSSVSPAAFGVVRILQEGVHQFDVLDSKSDISQYKLLVLPDQISISDELAGRLSKYIAQGGSLIASFESGLNNEKSDFSLRELGVRKKSDGPVGPEGELVRGRAYPRNHYAEYILPKGQIGKGLPETEHVMYMKGMDVEAMGGSVILADIINSYFDRTFEHFCSHRQTPSSGEVGSPAVVQNGRVIYFSHPIFTQYQKNAPRWCKLIFLNAVKMLLPEPIVRLEAPTTTLTAVNEQFAENRWVLHLLHYIPERRGQDFDIIEDMIPIFNVKVSVKPLKRVKRVVQVPQKKALKFTQRGGRVEFVLPKLGGHQMIALNF